VVADPRVLFVVDNPLGDARGRIQPGCCHSVFRNISSRVPSRQVSPNLVSFLDLYLVFLFGQSLSSYSHHGPSNGWSPHRNITDHAIRLVQMAMDTTVHEAPGDCPMNPFLSSRSRPHQRSSFLLTNLMNHLTQMSAHLHFSGLPVKSIYTARFSSQSRRSLVSASLRHSRPCFSPPLLGFVSAG